MNICKLLITAVILTVPFAAYPAVSPQELNSKAGLKLFSPDGDWSTAKIETSLRSSGIVMRGSRELRGALLNRRLVFGIPAQEIKCANTPDGKTSVIDIIYFNKGDNSKGKRLDNNIRDAARLLRKQLTNLAGKPERGKYGPKGMHNKVEVWKTASAEFLLEYIPGEFTILHIRRPDENSGDSRKSASVTSTKGKDEFLAGHPPWKSAPPAQRQVLTEPLVRPPIADFVALPEVLMAWLPGQASQSQVVASPWLASAWNSPARKHC
jgi:hypothetical protein